MAAGLSINTSAYAQNDEAKAKTILDEISKKTKAYKTIKADFTVTTASKDQQKNVQQGSIQVKGNKYRLSIKGAGSNGKQDPGQEFINDSKTIWNIQKTAKEVMIDNAPDPAKAKKGEIQMDKIFTLYEKGFKYKFVKETTAGGVTKQQIDLVPTDPKSVDYHRIELQVDKAKKQISSVKFIKRDQSTQVIDIKSFVPDTDIPETNFTFDAKAYPGYTVEDLR